MSRRQAKEFNRVRLQVINIINLDYCLSNCVNFLVRCPVFNTSWIFAGVGLVNPVSSSFS